ncbi:MAG: ACT domain-containing protein [Clostridiales bacterium]|nr:ACT domain-containing protein [Clostridiales bacterium]
MEIEKLKESLSVCKVASVKDISLDVEPCFVGITNEEISLVCSTQNVPLNTVAREDGWGGFKISGVLDFSLVGILAGISSILADGKIGIFAISTYNTDYILVKKENFSRAEELLKNNGYTVKG